MSDEKIDLGLMERTSWSKFWRGMTDPTAYVKTLAILLRAGLLVLIIASVVFSVLWLKSVFLPSKRGGAQKVIITGQQGGQVHNSTDEIRKKVGLLNIF